MSGHHLLDERLRWQGSTDDATFPVAVIPTARITAVRCSEGHALGGMFMLFRPAAVGPLADRTGARAWHLAMTTHDEAWLGPADPTDFFPGESELAWPQRYASMVPDAYKLMPAQEYECYCIQHPSRAFAHRIAREIGAGADAYGPPLRITAGRGELVVPEALTSFVPRGGALYNGWILYRDMPHARCRGVARQVQRAQAHLGAMRYVVGTSNAPYLPDVGVDMDKSGGVNDGVFDLRTMAAVASFQQDAAAGTAFVVEGAPHDAYIDHAYDPKVDRAAIAQWHARAKELRAKAKPAKKVSPAADDAREAAAEADRLDREAERAQTDATLALGQANSWQHLVGRDATLGARLIRDEGEVEADGVIDADTAAVIKHWLDAKARKPGPVLVLTKDNRDWSNWLRPEAAQALVAFDALSVAMGFAYGVSVNHTFRSALVDIGHAGYGRSAKSIHKTGAAIDLGMTGFSGTVEAFPIVYEREVDGDRVWWRLFGPCAQPAAGTDEELAALADKLDRLATAKPELPHAHDALHPIAARLAAAFRSDARDAFARFYRRTVHRWNYDAFHPEGGTPGASTTCEREAARRVGARTNTIEALEARERELIAAVANMVAGADLKARQQELKKTRADLAHARHERERELAHGSSFLDLTALAEACGLRRIHSFRTGWAQTTKSVKAAEVAKLAELLDAASKALAEHPEMLDRASVTRGKTRFDTTVASIDGPFVKTWSEALASLRKDAPRSVKVLAPQVVITLSHTPEKKADAAKISAVLRALGSKRLAGLVRTEGTPPVQTAVEWAAYIDDRVCALEAAWTAMQTPPSATPAGRTPRVPSAKPSPQSSVLQLQPIFVKGFELAPGADARGAVWFQPGDVVTVPAEGQPIGMEWWHLQCASVLTTTETVPHPKTHRPEVRAVPRLWGALLLELGYHLDALRHGPSPTLHLREGMGYPDTDLESEAH
ncbi:MAG: hypothetical protein U0326_17405 [Polyangiales bacterium]